MYRLSLVLCKRKIVNKVNLNVCAYPEKFSVKTGETLKLFRHKPQILRRKLIHVSVRNECREKTTESILSYLNIC